MESGVADRVSAQVPLPASEHGRTLRIGCALLPKKVSRYLTPSMKAIARSQGVELMEIDQNMALQEQGPFDAIIHKLCPNKDWERRLMEYCKDNPDVAIIDRVDGIRALQNRSTMLFPLHGDGVLLKDEHSTSPAVRVQAPQQVVIHEGTSLSEAQSMLEAAGLQAPLLVKPLWTDGREGSHGLAVLHDIQSLGQLLSGKVSSELQPPLVVQRFVDHGGVLFKVYVLGERSVVSERPSLGDEHLGHAARSQGVLQLPRISCTTAYLPATHSPVTTSLSGAAVLPTIPALAPKTAQHGSSGGLSDCSHTSISSSRQESGVGSGSEAAGQDGPCAGTPPEWMTHRLAGVLRDRLGLQLFNFDLICPEDQPNPAECLYYVIDINYFPGVDKIPDFERIFVDFLKAACVQGPAGVQGAGRLVAPAAAAAVACKPLIVLQPQQEQQQVARVCTGEAHAVKGSGPAVCAVGH